MLTYQRSKFCSRQSCSQSVDGGEGAFEALHFAAYEQLWLTYKAMQRTASRAAPHVLRVCDPSFGRVARSIALAVADLVSR
ncbi:MAG: hypothetical protein DMG85_09915 [Acidobacteria bacterium]|nr:MAG: hypothetical protein DMG85_09915 [Acidobacteriota bacterium]